MFRITDTKKAYDYDYGFATLEEACKSAQKRPAGFARYIIMDNNGRTWNLSGERIYI